MPCSSRDDRYTISYHNGEETVIRDNVLRDDLMRLIIDESGDWVRPRDPDRWPGVKSPFYEGIWTIGIRQECSAESSLDRGISRADGTSPQGALFTVQKKSKARRKHETAAGVVQLHNGLKMPIWRFLTAM